MKKKKIFIWVIAWIFVLFLFGIFSQTKFFSKKFWEKNIITQFISKISNSAQAGYFDSSRKKIPVNAKYIDFTFSKNLDKKTIKKENFFISPKIKWDISLVDGNIIRFTPKEKFKLNENYSVILNNKIMDSNWNNIPESSFNIKIVSEAKVLKITPSWNLQNLDQNFVVFFNVPMVPLTDLDSRDKLACPISFKPEVKWKCKWTTTSVLEFIPEKRLFGSTKYEVKVQNVKGLKYPIKSKKIIVKTTALNFYFPYNFDPKQWINFSSNFDVSLDEMKKNLVLSDINISDCNANIRKKWISISKFIKTEYKCNNKKNNFLDIVITKNNNNFNIKLKNQNFLYNKKYYLKFKNKINSVHWNIPYFDTNIEVLKTNWFLEWINVYRKIYSETGALINTKKIYLWKYWANKYIPVKNLFFNLSFKEEIELNKNYFSFVSSTWKKIDFKIEYIKEKKFNEKNKKTEIILNKKRIKLTLKQKLENSEVYFLKISKNINKYLKEDIEKKYFSAKKLKIKDFRIINYKKTCLYLSNRLNFSRKNIEKVLTTTPKSQKSYIEDYDYIPYKIRKEIDYKSTYLEKKEFFLKKWYCYIDNDYEYWYVIKTKLNPNTFYQVKINNWFEDIYGNKLEKWYVKKIKTWNIEENDKYLYFWASKYINIIPNNLPIVINLKTINLDKVNLEVCEMNWKAYFDYLKNNYKRGFKPNCINKKSGYISVKNRFWNISYNKIDLEKDFLKQKFKTNFILIKWSKLNWSSSFSNIYIRENLSVAFENWANKKLLFVSDFKWNIKTNVWIYFYKYNYKTNQINPVKIKVNLNKNTKVFEINSADSNLFDYIFVEDKNNPQNIWLVDLNNDFLSNYWFNYISWNSSAQKKFLYLYTERPIYKPGDTVFVKWLLREFKSTWYTKTNIKEGQLELIGPEGKIIDTKKVIVWKNSNFNTKFIIPKDVNLGKFRFRFKEIIWKKSYIVSNNAYFDIEEYKKPSFKVEINTDKKSDYIIWDKLNFKINPKYYFGWKIRNTSWNYSILTQDYYFDAKDYSDYQFGEWYSYFDCIYWWACKYEDFLEKTWKFEINKNWEYTFNYNFSWKDIKWEKIYNFNFEITEPNTKRVVNKTISKVLHNTDAYVWLKTDYYNSIKSWININAIVLDYDAKPKIWKKVKIELIKKDWKSVKKQWVDWVFYNDYSLKKTLEKTIFAVSDKLWQINKKIFPKKSWEYEIKLTYTWINNHNFVSSSDIYVEWNNYVEWHNDNNDITEFVADKIQAKVGEKIWYVLKSPINSWKVLIAIEKDNDILDYFVHDLKSYSDRIFINVKNTYYPNYYLKAYLIWSQKNNPLPVYKRALIVTKVNTDYKKLKIQIKTNKKDYLPGEPVSLEIKVLDSKWRVVPNADLSISLVDESLLALKWNPKKNPYAFFYDLKRFLWIETYSSLKNLVKKLEVKNAKNWEKWGSGESVKWWDSKKKRWNFKDTAFWKANISTDKNWIAKIKTDKLPDNLTTWVIEVLANTSNDTKVWVNYETIKTTKKLLINDNLPRFFGSTDTIVLSPVIFNKTWKTQKFKISLDITNAKIIWERNKEISIESWKSKLVKFKIKVNDIGISENKNLFNSKINFKVISTNWKYVDEVEKFLKIKEVSTQESISTFGKTNKTSYEEKIKVWKIKKWAWKLTINYSATLLTSILDGIKYLNNYPYGCSEQKTSAIMPNIFIKQLYNSAWEKFDLKKKIIKYWISSTKWYWEKSLDQVIKEYLVNIRKYQNIDWWFVYFYDVNTDYGPNYSNFALTSYILESGAEIKKVWYKLDKKTYDNAVKYLKNRFYKNKIEWCRVLPTSSLYNSQIDRIKKYRCEYSETDRLKAISAILEYNPNDYEAYKMYKLIDFSKINSFDVKLEKVKVIAKLLKSKSIKLWKTSLEKESKKIIDKIISENLVFNPKWAFVWKSKYYLRFENTVSLLEAISTIWLEKFSDIDKIIDNINRWIISQKQNWSFGSTSDNIAVIKAITKYLESSWELKNLNFDVILKLNNQKIEQKHFDNKNKFQVFTKILKLSNIKNSNSFIIEKNGKWNIYYDLNLSYYKNAKNIRARDEWFFVETKYYKYSDYEKIKRLKDEEWKKYLDNKISYDKLKYPKEIFEYLDEQKQWKVGELLIVRNKIITTETRDKVAFESYIPSGSELVNPKLATSSKKEIWWENLYFSKKEYRTDRLFAYKNILYPWIYNFTYLIRLTHWGEYSIKPTKVSEFYNIEVFGRDKWKIFTIED